MQNGILSSTEGEIIRGSAFGCWWDALGSNGYVPGWGWSTNPKALRYVFGKMGYRLLEDADELAWINENTRLGLAPQQFRQYAVKVAPNNSAEISKPGLWQTVLLNQGSIGQTPDVTSYPVRRVPGPVMAFTGDSYTEYGSGFPWTWSENKVFVYRGQMWMNAGTSYTFGSYIDDWCLIQIDGQAIIQNTSCSFSSGAYTCSNSGWHDIEIRVGNNGGPGGVGGSSGWKSNVGIGYNTSNLTSENNGNGWTRLVDPGDGSLLRTTGVVPEYVVFDPE